MSRWASAAAAWPGVVLAGLALAGWVPHARDLPAYFVPLRQHTARVLRGEASPFWLEQIGCGEPFLANPQSALFYPPAWGALVLPPARAVGVEVGLHLALLAVGAARLARRLGASAGWSVAAGWGAAAAGPVLDSAGVLNNLTTLAWLPWGWEAALAGRLRRCALFTALAGFAGEPQLAAMGAAVSWLLVPRRRTGGALLLAAGLTAVQAVPFAGWVAAGDRGARMEVAEAARGALGVEQLAALIFPSAGEARGEFRFVLHPTLPLWALLGVALALATDGPARRLAGVALACGAVAVLASLPAGGEVWHAVTFGLLRYPARLLFPAAVMAAVAGAVGLGRARWPRGVGAAVALALTGAGVVAGAPLPGVLAQATAGLAPVAPWGAGAAALGALALGGQQVVALQLRRSASVPVACGEAQRAAARLFLVEPSRAMFQWVAEDPQGRLPALGLGYLALQDGRATARSFAPLVHAALAEHLRQADRGPAGRWWLNALGADGVVSWRPLAGFARRCVEGGVVVMDNPAAFPLTAVVARLPAPGEEPALAGALLGSQQRGSYHRWVVRVAEGGGVFMRLATPETGWRFWVDGRRQSPVRGAGILHGVPLPAGDHVVEARYRPPGWPLGTAVTLLALVVLVWLRGAGGKGERVGVGGGRQPEETRWRSW